MSNTKKHKDKGKWNNDIIKEIPYKLQMMFNRHNWDVGEFRKAKKNLQEKIAKKELKEEIRVVETEENIDCDIPEQDKILKQIMGK